MHRTVGQNGYQKPWDTTSLGVLAHRSIFFRAFDAIQLPAFSDFVKTTGNNTWSGIQLN